MANMELVPGILSFFSGLGVWQKIPPTTQGWGRVAWGMSFDTVKMNYPQAEEISGRELEYVPDSNTLGQNYKCTFSFDGSRRLNSFAISFGGSGETADYATLVQELSRYLGTPAAATSTGTTWRRDENQIPASKRPEGGLVV